MNKRVLIISPYFPPTNAADIHRVRTSLPYLKQYGWEAEIVTVDHYYADLQEDNLLFETLPGDIIVHQVKAWNKKWTSKLGLGSIALRSYWFYRKKVSSLLKERSFDLIYFSTTQFPVCALGGYWKRRFGVPYVIDMQDPWHSDYYLSKSRQERPPKYWFIYHLNKFLERIAMKQVDGLISVSGGYLNDLKNRYPQIKHIPTAVIPFGSFQPDIEVAIKNNGNFTNLLDPEFKNIVCIGRGGRDMHQAITPLFKVFKQNLDQQPGLYSRLKFHFIGTSYAPNGKGIPTIAPLARQFGIQEHVIEITDRISYFHALATLQNADGLFIPGSDDPTYTASKIFPYLLIKKPLLTLFHSKSPANKVLKEHEATFVYHYNTGSELSIPITDFLMGILNDNYGLQEYHADALKKYATKNLTGEQCDLFNRVLNEMV